jgi:hypothetical protein
LVLAKLAHWQPQKKAVTTTTLELKIARFTLSPEAI